MKIFKMIFNRIFVVGLALILQIVVLIAFMNHCANRIGECYFRTPRTTIKGFLDLLSVLDQYPSVKWDEIIDNFEVEADVEESDFSKNTSKNQIITDSTDDEFTTFKL